jgi:hypothetical protein
MTEAVVELRYDGPAVADHKMDVDDLAPALPAFGSLCKEANRVLNGDRANLKVLVNADMKANCITISFEVVWSFLEAAKLLIQDDRVATVKEILEWLGLSSGSGAAIGLLAFLKLRSNQATQETSFIDQDGGNVVKVQVQGDNNVVQVVPQVRKLADDPKVVEAAKRLLRPVAVREGIDRATFKVNGRVAADIDKASAKAISEATVPRESEAEPEDEYIVGNITVYGPILDARAGVWKFKLPGNVQPIEISDSGIAEAVLRRGKIVVGDRWRVRLKVSEKKSKTGGSRTEYKVVEVFGFEQGPERAEFAWKRSDDDFEGSP